MLKMSDDMDWKQYRLKCEKLKANIQKRWRKSNIQKNTNEYNSIQMDTYTNTNTNTDTNTNTNTNTDVVITNSNELAIPTTIQKKITPKGVSCC